MVRVRYSRHTALALILAATAGAAGAQTTPHAASETTATDTGTTVVVTGKTAPVVRKIDRAVYDVKDQAQAQTGTLADVLNTLPSVTVSPDGAVTIRGQSAVQILIDGKPAASMKGANRATTLQTMSANAISKVEVVTNPGAQFRTDSGMVINVITKKSQNTGASGDLVINAGNEGRYNGSLSGTLGLGKLTLNGALSVRHDNRRSRSHTERSQTTDDGDLVARLTEDYAGRVRFDVGTLDAGATYALSETDSLSLTTQLSSRKPSREIGDRIRLFDDTDALYSDTLTNSFGPTHQNQTNLTATWRHTGQREGESFVLTARHDEVDALNDRRYFVIDNLRPSAHRYFDRDDQLAGADSAYRIRRSSRELTDELSGDYVLPLGEDTQWTAGFSVEASRLQSWNYFTDIAVPSGTETVDDDLTNRFLIEQTLSAAYVTYQQPLGQWLLQGGLRVENMLTRVRDNRNAPYLTLSDVQWSPSLYFSRDLSDTRKLKLSYSKRIERPEQFDLNPQITNNGGQDIYVGNPYLKPGQIQSFEAGYDYTTKPFSYSATAYYRRSTDTITDYAYFISDTVLLSTRENAGDGQSAGVNMAFDFKPAARWGYSLNADVFYTELGADIEGVETRRSTTSYVGKATLDYKPRDGIAYQINAQAYGPTLTAQGTQAGSTVVNLSYSRKITDRLKLVVTGNNVFDSMRYDNLIQTRRLRDRTVIRFQGQTIFVGLSYKLGTIKAGS